MKNTLLRMLCGAALMLGGPYLAVTFAPGDAGMAVCFVLFFAGNPIFCLADGWLAGKDPSKTRQEPLFMALLFLLGAWLFFDRTELAFYYYALTYLALGYIAMVVSAFVHRRR